jgi:hypothetical protein
MADDYDRGRTERDVDIESAQEASRATDERW